MINTLIEDTRNQLISKSKNADLYKSASTRGKNRFERRVYSKIANQVKSYNEIDMGKLFKSDLLEVTIPVIGETDTYSVTLSFDGVMAEIARNIKNNQNRFEYRTVLQALTKVFNTSNIRVKCSCPDFKYRFQHQLIINNNAVDGTDKDPGPGKTGMANTQGKGCKHILAVLNNLSWIMQVTSVIKNYITYMDEHQHALFLKVMFPKLYGIPADAAIENNLVPEETNLESDTKLIDTINAWSRDRGKFKPGSNKNPVAYKQQNNNEKESK